MLTLEILGFKGFTDPSRVGVWIEQEDGREEKIAAIGVRVRKGVTYHGLALNVCPDLSPFDHIIPCGLSDFGVCSLYSLGYRGSMEEVDQAFQQTFAQAFNL